MTRYLEIKPGSISETIKRLSDDYQALFKKELEKAGKGIGSMTPDEKKAFFNKIDKMHNAKNEAATKPDDSKTTMVVKPGAPAGQEKVIRIPKEKLADYKSKGYVEAESYIPEAKKIDELTAGQKKLPPALQKAIKAKEKKEEVEVEIDEMKVYRVGGQAYAGKATDPEHQANYRATEQMRSISAKRKQLEKELKALNKDDPSYKEKSAQKRKEIETQRELMARKQKEVYGSYDPSREDDLDLNEGDLEEVKLEDKNSGGIDALRAIKGKRLRLQGELERLNKDDPSYKEKAANLRGQIEKQKEIMANKQREVYGSYDPSREDALDLNEGDLEEACWTGYKKVGMKKKGDRMVPNCVPEGYVTESGDIVEFVELDEGQFKDIDVRKGDLKLAKDKKEQLKNKYNAIMANQAQGDEDSIADQIQKLEMSIKKQEQELIDIMKKGKENQKNEAVDPERVQKLNQKIANMTTKMGELDRSKPENKTKEAIMKSDIATAKLRLQDLMQKGASDVKKAVNEASKAKQSYKSLKMSLKKEQDINNKKKTLTDKPITKIEVNPKIEG